MQFVGRSNSKPGQTLLIAVISLNEDVFSSLVIVLYVSLNCKNSVLLFCNNSIVTRFVYAHILKGNLPIVKISYTIWYSTTKKNPESIAFGFRWNHLGGKKICTKVLGLWVHLIHVRYAWAIYKHVISNIICPLVVLLIGWNKVSPTQNSNVSGEHKTDHRVRI